MTGVTTKADPSPPSAKGAAGFGRTGVATKADPSPTSAKGAAGFGRTGVTTKADLSSSRRRSQEGERRDSLGMTIISGRKILTLKKRIWRPLYGGVAYQSVGGAGGGSLDVAINLQVSLTALLSRLVDVLNTASPPCLNRVNL
jgi:hypothetical protein